MIIMMKLTDVAALIGRIFYLRTEMICADPPWIMSDIRHARSEHFHSSGNRRQAILVRGNTFLYIYCAQPPNRISLFSINRPGTEYIVDVFSCYPRNQ